MTYKYLPRYSTVSGEVYTFDVYIFSSKTKVEHIYIFQAKFLCLFTLTLSNVDLSQGVKNNQVSFSFLQSLRVFNGLIFEEKFV